MVSFTFKGSDISTAETTGTEILVTRIARPLMPPVTRHKVEIPGRAGAWDFGGGVERDFLIPVDITIVAQHSSQIMPCQRKIADTLAGKGSLIFSDDTGQTYNAQVFEGIMPEPVGAGNVVRATIIFECDASTSTST